MLRRLGLLLAVVPIVVLLSAFSEVWLGPNDYAGMPSPDALPSPTHYPVLQAVLAHASDQVKAGSDTFHVVCATCHGPTGKGYQEARMAFIPDHRACERCHRPANPARWADTAITARNSFSIGQPPALRGTDLLQEYPTPSALFHFLKSAMPRYDPGKFSDATYVRLTAFLLALNGAMPPGAHLSGAPGDLAVTP